MTESQPPRWSTRVQIQSEVLGRRSATRRLWAGAFDPKSKIPNRDKQSRCIVAEGIVLTAFTRPSDPALLRSTSA